MNKNIWKSKPANVKVDKASMGASISPSDIILRIDNIDQDDLSSFWPKH